MNEYTVQELSLTEIYLDDSFNCRGSISVADIVDLAESIKQHGLQFPIAVQPVADIPAGLPEGKQFRMVAGHRRYKAFELLKRLTIPAMVRSGLTELQALILNLDENLNRKQLNILQEAKAVQKLYQHGLTQKDIAKKLQHPSGWVYIRFVLLKLPDEIQEEAAAGLLTQYDIKRISEASNISEQYQIVKRIKDDRVRRLAFVPKKDKSDKWCRSVEEIKVCMTKLDPQSLAYWVAGWSAGLIGDADLARKLNG